MYFQKQPSKGLKKIGVGKIIAFSKHIALIVYGQNRIPKNYENILLL